MTDKLQICEGKGVLVSRQYAPIVGETAEDQQTSNPRGDVVRSRLSLAYGSTMNEVDHENMQSDINPVTNPVTASLAKEDKVKQAKGEFVIDYRMFLRREALVEMTNMFIGEKFVEDRFNKMIYALDIARYRRTTKFYYTGELSMTLSRLENLLIKRPRFRKYFRSRYNKNCKVFELTFEEFNPKIKRVGLITEMNDNVDFAPNSKREFGRFNKSRAYVKTNIKADVLHGYYYNLDKSEKQVFRRHLDRNDFESCRKMVAKPFIFDCVLHNQREWHIFLSRIGYKYVSRITEFGEELVYISIACVAVWYLTNRVLFEGKLALSKGLLAIENAKNDVKDELKDLLVFVADKAVNTNAVLKDIAHTGNIGDDILASLPSGIGEVIKAYKNMNMTMKLAYDAQLFSRFIITFGQACRVLMRKPFDGIDFGLTLAQFALMPDFGHYYSILNGMFKRGRSTEGGETFSELPLMKKLAVICTTFFSTSMYKASSDQFKVMALSMRDWTGRFIGEIDFFSMITDCMRYVQTSFIRFQETGNVWDLLGHDRVSAKLDRVDEALKALKDPDKTFLVQDGAKELINIDLLVCDCMRLLNKKEYKDHPAFRASVLELKAEVFNFKLKINSSRMPPLGLIIHGVPGTGKTELVKSMANIIKARLKIDKDVDIVFTRQNTKHQTLNAFPLVYLMNDYFQVRDSESEEPVLASLQMAADSTLCKMETASLEEKERSMIDPYLVAVTTNATNFVFTKTHNGACKLNRRYLCIKTSFTAKAMGLATEKKVSLDDILKYFPQYDDLIDYSVVRMTNGDDNEIRFTGDEIFYTNSRIEMLQWTAMQLDEHRKVNKARELLLCPHGIEVQSLPCCCGNVDFNRIKCEHGKLCVTLPCSCGHMITEIGEFNFGAELETELADDLTNMRDRGEYPLKFREGLIVIIAGMLRKDWFELYCQLMFHAIEDGLTFDDFVVGLPEQVLDLTDTCSDELKPYYYMWQRKKNLVWYSLNYFKRKIYDVFGHLYPEQLNKINWGEIGLTVTIAIGLIKIEIEEVSMKTLEKIKNMSRRYITGPMGLECGTEFECTTNEYAMSYLKCFAGMLGVIGIWKIISKASSKDEPGLIPEAHISGTITNVPYKTSKVELFKKLLAPYVVNALVPAHENVCLIYRKGREGLASVFCIPVADRVVMLNKHFFTTVELNDLPPLGEGEEMTLQYQGIERKFYFRQENVVFIGYDLAFLYVELPYLPNSVFDVIIDEVDYFDEGTVNWKKKQLNMSLTKDKEVALVKPRSSEVGDCGTPYWRNEKLIAIHGGRINDGTAGYAIPVDKKMVNRAFEALRARGKVVVHLKYDTDYNPGNLVPQMAQGKTDMSWLMRNATIAEIAQNDLWEVGALPYNEKQKMTCGPTSMHHVFSKYCKKYGKPWTGKARMIDGEWKSPITKRFHSNVTHSIPFDFPEKEVKGFYKRLIVRAGLSKLEPLTDYEVFCGSPDNHFYGPKDPTKAVGPINNFRKIKKSEAFKANEDGSWTIHPQILEDMRYFEECLRNNEIPFRITKASYKDEVVEEPECKARLFYVNDVAFNLLCKKYMRPLFAKILGKPEIFGIFAAINPGSADWGMIVEFLRVNSLKEFYKKSEFSDFDQKSFEHHHSWMIHLLMNFFYDFARANGYTIDDANLVRNLVYASFVRMLILEGVLYLTKTHMDSGLDGTAMFNSLINIFLFVGISIFFGKEPEDCPIGVLGDDAVIRVKGVPLDLKEVFSKYTEWGYAVQTSDKDGKDAVYKPLTECTFLKRGFSCIDDVWKAPLLQESIFKSLAYTTAVAVPMVERDQNALICASKEFYLHGRSEYQKFSDICSHAGYAIRDYEYYDKEFNNNQLVVWTHPEQNTFSPLDFDQLLVSQ